jgi:hypothetical protein
MLFRDSRGRIRNSDKTPPEIIEAIYEGKKVEIPVIEKVIEGKKKVFSKEVTKTGKQRFQFEEIITYKQGDFTTTKKAFEQAQELKKIVPQLEKKEEIEKIKKSKISASQKKELINRRNLEIERIIEEPNDVNTFLRWEINNEVLNSEKENKTIYFRGKKRQATELIKELRERISNADLNSEGNYDILFEVEYFDDEIRILDFKEEDYDEQ